MIIVQGWVRLDPGSIDAMRMAAETMAAATRAEGGCLDYCFSVDISDPGLLRISELWTDEQALAAHFQTPHMAAFNAAIAGAKAQGASVKAYAATELRTLMGF